MRCTCPGAVTPEDLVAYVDGDASGDVMDHIRECAVCAAEARQYARAQRRMGRSLFRFDCPPPQILGEYHLAMVPPEDRQAIAAHVVDCPRCADELATLRAFMVTDVVEPMSAPGLGERLRRVVATLLAPSTGPAYAGLRGSTDERVRTYLAGDVAITISFAPQPRRRLGTVVGLVTHQGTSAGSPIGRDVILEEAVPQAATGSTRHAQIDDLGNFTFDDVAFGTYRLIVRLADEIVVEDFPVGS
jgi:hypothetical protein